MSILSGLRILDLSAGLAGSVAARHYLESGAEVVRIEPEGGDPLRGSPAYNVRNRGKKSVCLDISTSEGRKRVDQLLSAADLLIHDYTPATARTLELDCETLAKRFPELVTAPITAWPAGHRDEETPVDESLVLARLGLFDEQPGHRPGPVFIRMPFASWAASWLCAIGSLSRLILRDRGHAAGPARTSLAQAALTPMTMHWARAEAPSESFARGLDKNVAIAIHQCSDGRWIHVHYSPDASPWMKAALEALGADGVAAANARWGRNHTAPNFGANREIFATRPAQDWLEHFWRHDVAAQAVAPFGDIYFDAQARANGYVAEVDDPDLGPTLQPGATIHTVPPSRMPAPVHAPDADAEDVFASWTPRPVRAAIIPDPPSVLHGLKVLDCGSHIAGPYGPMLLADLGADVIKLEPPKGDAMRYVARAFCGAQRGKRGLALQLGAPQSRSVVEALVRQADIVHHNMRMPAARKLGIDPESLRAMNPEIISCHVSSYGPHGPRADWPGFDQMFQSSCGWEIENGGAGNPPMWLRFGITDHLAALASVFATLLALWHRDHTGRGQHVAASLLGATIATVGETVARADGFTFPIEKLDQAQTGLAPGHRIYECADRWVAVAALRDSERDAFARCVGDRPEAWFSARSAVSCLAELERVGVPCAPVRTQQHEPFLDDPENVKTRLSVAYPHKEMGMITQIGAFWDFGTIPVRLDRAPPTIGQHTREILSEAGIGSLDVDRLIADGLAAV